MGIGYQKTDRKAFDYELWFLPDISGFGVRGPRTDLSAADLTCFIGAAQTFGRFVERPFPRQVGDILQKSVLNLGFSGAGPEFYTTKQPLMDILGAAETVVVQSMSARSVSAGLFETQANNGVLKFLEGPRKGEVHLALPAYTLLRKDYGETAFMDQVAAAQTAWVDQHRKLADGIPGRKVFLWLSEIAPPVRPDLSGSALGTFPHLVTADMVQAVEDMGFETVESVLPDMMSQIIVNDTSGVIEEVFNPVDFPHRPDAMRAINNYYATPELHDLASRRLIRALIGGETATG